MFQRRVFTGLLALTLTAAGAAVAQTTVTLPDNSQTTTLTSNVSEQARVTVPANITFNVTNVNAATAASAASVSIDSIVLASDSKQLRVFVKAASPSFTPPVTGATTWASSDVTWAVSNWSNGTGAAGTLVDVTYIEVATCDADVTSCSTNNLVFTLAPKGSVKRSGNHTLNMSWKFESIGT
jgi:hypothetical protein